jgi:hypothetical protein
MDRIYAPTTHTSATLDEYATTQLRFALREAAQAAEELAEEGTAPNPVTPEQFTTRAQHLDQVTYQILATTHVGDLIITTTHALPDADASYDGLFYAVDA